MFTKQYISEIKKESGGRIAQIIQNQRDVGTITYILENLGQLPKEFEGDCLYDLLQRSPAIDDRLVK